MPTHPDKKPLRKPEVYDARFWCGKCQTHHVNPCRPTHPDSTPTPLPWKISEITRGYLSQPAIVAEGVMICKMPALTNMGGEVNSRADEIAENAKLIVHAVNSHHALVKSLKRMLRLHYDTAKASLEGLEASNEAEAALAATRP